MASTNQIILNYGNELDSRIRQPLAVTIGNFDGLHRGHRALIDQVNSLAQRYGVKSAVLCFNPHPDDFFSQQTTRRIFTTAQRTRALNEMGIEVVLIQDFSREFSQLKADEFVSHYLIEGLQAQTVVIGSDFRFGAGRKGDHALLKQMGRLKGLEVTVVDPLFANTHPIRSSVIRTQIAEMGNMELANDLLGHLFCLESNVTKGRQVGRTIGIPTINLGEIRQIIPKVGVYFGWFAAGSTSNQNHGRMLLNLPKDAAPCVINVGVRPSFEDASRVNVEAHIFDRIYPMDSFYGEEVSLYFAGRLRDEMKFDSKQSLISAIQNDIIAAKARLA